MDLQMKKLEQSKNQNNFTTQEKEVISLKVLIETIDSMVNFTLFDLLGEGLEAQILFHDEIHQKYFYIIAVDFLSKIDESITGDNVSCMGLLENICKNPSFNINNSISELKNAKDIFQSWLDKKVTVDTWFPSINESSSLKLTRNDFLYTCGNISKHNFARLGVVSKKICKILEYNNIKISFPNSLMLLDDFYERFHEDILNYHGSNIAEMLNNIRWGIHEYFLPEFNMSYKKDKSDPEEIRYSYIYPKDIKTDFAKTCYRGLINSVRKKPYVRRFKSTKYLKLRY